MCGWCIRSRSSYGKEQWIQVASKSLLLAIKIIVISCAGSRKRSGLNLCCMTKLQINYGTENRRVAGMANSFPFRWEEPLENLPEGGWDWAFTEAVQNHQQGVAPNVHCAIQIVVRPDYQGQGLSAPMVEAVRAVTRSKGLQSLIIPIRPSEKNKYPLTSLDDYITWKTEQGLPFDAWLRVHVRAGGKMIKVCYESKVIQGTCAEWEKWTRMQFPQSGQYVIDGALNPMEMNVEKDEGVYVEPNVWMMHETG